MHDVKNPIEILNEGRRRLAEGDTDGYWKLIGRYSPYAKLAAEIGALAATDGLDEAVKRFQTGLDTKGR